VKRFALAKSARIDLAEVWGYIGEDNPDYADAIVEGLFKRFRMLAITPYMGRGREEFGPAIRTIVDGDYVILYRVGRTGVRIVRVVHGKRNLRDLLED